MGQSKQPALVINLLADLPHQSETVTRLGTRSQKQLPGQEQGLRNSYQARNKVSATYTLAHSIHGSAPRTFISCLSAYSL